MQFVSRKLERACQILLFPVLSEAVLSLTPTPETTGLALTSALTHMRHLPHTLTDRITQKDSCVHSLIHSQTHTHRVLCSYFDFLKHPNESYQLRVTSHPSQSRSRLGSATYTCGQLQPTACVMNKVYRTAPPIHCMHLCLFLCDSSGDEE